MKSIFILSLATAMLCAEETYLQLPKIDEGEKAPKVVINSDLPETESYDFNRRFIPYVKLGPDIVNIADSNRFVPTLGAGLRSESNEGAVDLSVSFSSSVSKDGDKRTDEYQVFFPKVLYQKFVTPEASSTFFYGGGGSWGTMNKQTTVHTEFTNEEGMTYTKYDDIAEQNFTGLYADAVVGYEIGRDSYIRQIIQCNVSQPVLAYTREGNFPTPSLEMTYSLGF